MQEHLVSCDQENPGIAALVRIEEDHNLSLRLRNFFKCDVEISYKDFERNFEKRVGDPFDPELGITQNDEMRFNQDFISSAQNLLTGCQRLTNVCNGFADIFVSLSKGNLEPEIPTFDIWNVRCLL